MGGVKSDRLSNLIQDCDIRRKNQYSLFRMIRNITCQQVRLSCSGRLYNRSNAVLSESFYDSPVCRLVMGVKLHMLSGREALNITFIRNCQPVQFKRQRFRQESSVRHDSEIRIPISFAQ